MPKRLGFTCGPDELRGLAQAVLERAKLGGASGCECDVSEGYGLSVTVRKGRADVVEHNRDRSIGVSVYLGNRPKARRGHASTSDFSRPALEQTVDAALAIARHTAEDDCAGLPEPASPIVPLVLGEAEAALKASRLLEDQGFLVVAIRPPTVPKGTARLRLTFTAQHPDREVERLAELVRTRILTHAPASAAEAQ